MGPDDSTYHMPLNDGMVTLQRHCGDILILFYFAHDKKHKMAIGGSITFGVTTLGREYYFAHDTLYMASLVLVTIRSDLHVLAQC